MRSGMSGRTWLKCGVMVFAAAFVASFVAPLSAAAAPCANDALRTGPSAALPDCRAYELVSPPDANGRLLEALGDFGFATLHDLFPTELASPIRDSIVYE